MSDMEESQPVSSDTITQDNWREFFPAWVTSCRISSGQRRIIQCSYGGTRPCKCKKKPQEKAEITPSRPESAAFAALLDKVSHPLLLFAASIGAHP